MYILVSSQQQKSVVTLEDVDDCMHFHVVVQGLSMDEVVQAFERNDVGDLSDHESAWIKIALLRRLVPQQPAPDWSERFEGMLRFAERKGWLSDDRTKIQAHCVWNE